MRRHYKLYSSGFQEWDQKAHAETYLLFIENIGQNLSIDEVALSQGELYTFLTNKSGKGKHKTIVAVIQGTRSEDIKAVLEKIPLHKRQQVREITMDMAKNMESSVRDMFPNSRLVIDRFHVVKLVSEALQQIRIKLRWQAIEDENIAIKKAKENKKKYVPLVLKNGDSPKQLLARTRYALGKNPDDWTDSQKKRIVILFNLFPSIKKAYKHTLHLKSIYKHNHTPSYAKVLFEQWIQKTNDNKLEDFYSASNSISYHLDNIVNFFHQRHTNANAESFNAKIKLFRANLRGVVDNEFFLFRITKLFA